MTKIINTNKYLAERMNGRPICRCVSNIDTRLVVTASVVGHVYAVHTLLGYSAQLYGKLVLDCQHRVQLVLCGVDE